MSRYIFLVNKFSRVIHYYQRLPSRFIYFLQGGIMRLSRLMYAIAVFFFLTVQVVAQYSASLPYRDVSVTMDNGVASFKGAPLTGEPGQPFMPVYTVTFLLPSDADFTNAKVTLENQTEKELEGTFDVQPALPTIIDNKPVWPNGRKIIDGKDIGIYSRNDFFLRTLKEKSNSVQCATINL